MKALKNIFATTIFLIGLSGAIGSFTGNTVLTSWKLTYNMAFPTSIAFMITGICFAIATEEQ